MAIDWEFIAELEGNENTTYIPKQDGEIIENSGVTIGTGIDLGQQSRAELKELGVSDKILDKLEPFFNKSRQEAQEALEANGPVTLEDDEISQLNSAIKNKTVKQIKDWYNTSNKQGQDWSDLTDRQQTVVSSVFFQYGMEGAPKFKSQVEEGDWDAAVENLKNFTPTGEFQSRRNKEIQYLLGTEPTGNLKPQTEQLVEPSQSPEKAPERPSEAPQQQEQGQPTTRLDRLIQRGSQGLKQSLHSEGSTVKTAVGDVQDEELQQDVRERRPSLMDRAVESLRGRPNRGGL